MDKQTDIFKHLKTGPTPVGTQKSAQWYRDTVKQLAGKNIRRSDLMNHRERLVKRVMPGKMYLFMYDPKHKATLPYYDMFPLVLPYRAVAGGFYGLNFHYLPYQLRFLVLQNLMKFASNKAMNETTRINASWQMLNSISAHKALGPCVKHYLYPHVRSQFLNIHYNEWATAIMLPVESFHGATKQQVWKDSRKKAGI